VGDIHHYPTRKMPFVKANGQGGEGNAKVKGETIRAVVRVSRPHSVIAGGLITRSPTGHPDCRQAATLSVVTQPHPLPPERVAEIEQLRRQRMSSPAIAPLSLRSSARISV
jgi:hypothetical protein